MTKKSIDMDTKNHEKNQLPKPFLPPRPWPYNKSWAKMVLGKNVSWSDLDDICGIDGAGSKISDYFFYTTPRALEKITIQNTLISQIINKKIQPEELGRIDVDWQSGNTWARILQETEIIFNVYNVESAPKDILEGIQFTKSIFEQGAQHAEQIINYIESCVAAKEERRNADFKRAQEERAIQRQILSNEKAERTAKWNEIDIEHSKVENGFIYALKNDLMPGVYKIGFTAYSPDNRANQLTQQYGLPSPFLVAEFWRTKDPYIVEQRIHKKLSANRRAGEFFSIELDELKEVVSNCLIK